MGPKDNGKSSGTNILQTNGFSTLIVSLMDSLTSIANGNKSGFCAATPDSWIVRLLNMGVAKVVIMGLLTALDRTVPPSPNALIGESQFSFTLHSYSDPIISLQNNPLRLRTWWMPIWASSQARAHLLPSVPVVSLATWLATELRVS